MKILIDGDVFSIVGHVTELLAITGLAQDGIKRRRTGGGASQHAIKVTVELDNAAKRGLAEMSHVRHQNATSLADEPELDADSRNRVISVREAAADHKVDPRTILRWKDRDPSMIVASEGRRFRLDRDAVDAYASGRPNRYGSAA
jgi:hypothetical protein